jgi:hypothetical protein
MNMQPPKPLKPQGANLRTTDRELGHETRDINITGVVAFVVTLMFSGIVIFVVLYGVFRFATNYALKQDAIDQRDPWVRTSESEIEARAKQLRTPKNKAEEPASMEGVDAEARIRVSRFPQPRLQTDDVHDLAIMREAEDEYLNNYFVIDKNTGKVNIPIQQAMQAVVQKGLPAMAAQPGTPLPPTAESTGIVRPSIESSHAKERGSPLRER